MKKVLNETGLRNIKDLNDRYKKSQDILPPRFRWCNYRIMKNYLENNGIDVVDAEIIQYGDKEFAVKKLDVKEIQCLY